MTESTLSESWEPDDGDLTKRQRQIDELISQIRDTADRLVRDEATRGDLKIMSRSLRELRYAFKVFAPYRGTRKVTVFGSARTLPDHPSYTTAQEFGRQMAAEDWLVITGAGSGIMEAGHRGAGRTHSMGLNILLPFEQQANPTIHGDDKLVHMRYFFTRKLMFVKECDAVVCLPGGFGTLDEAFEVLTLLQTGKRDLFPVVLLDEPGGTYWQHLDAFIRSELVTSGLISGEDFALYKITDSCEEAVQEVVSFYRGYHSMRFVRNQLVLRLQRALSPALLDAIRAEFAELLVDGDFEQCEALPAEDEPAIAELPRLVFHFNRRNLGRLRLLIDCINQASIEPASRDLNGNTGG